MMTMGRELVMVLNVEGSLISIYIYCAISHLAVVVDGGEGRLNNKKEINSTDNKFN